MRLIAILMLSMLLTSARAEDKDKDRYCIQLAAAYVNAVMARNAGLEPEQALSMSDFRDITVEKKKQVINQVYFDPAFAGAIANSDLRYEILQVCLHGPKKPFTPLK